MNLSSAAAIFSFVLPWKKLLNRSIFIRLQADGYKIWIDVEQMGGSTLEAMAEAVENAMVVLVCASEKYKLSPNCRTGKHEKDTMSFLW